MKVNVNTRNRRNLSVKALHSTVQQNISKPSSTSSVNGVAGKLRSLSVVLSDIAKNKDLLTHQGWESVGHGVWKLKCDFQLVTRHFREKRNPTKACCQEDNVAVSLEDYKLRRTSSLESVPMVRDLRSKKPLRNGNKTLSLYNSSLESEVVEIPVDEQPVYALKMVGGSEAGIAPQESNMINKGIEKSIKVNLLRQKIGPSGEMGWRVRRKDSFQKDSIIPDSKRLMRRLSVELTELDSIRQKSGGKVENRANLDENLVSVSLGKGKTKESSNEVVLGSRKRRNGTAVRSPQVTSVPSTARKTRGESLKNSTKEQGCVDCPKNEKVRNGSNNGESIHLYSTKGKRDCSNRECEDLLHTDTPRPSKIRAVDISCESKTVASSRLRRKRKRGDKSNDVPATISSQSEINKTVGGTPVIRALTLGERKSPRFSLNLENGRRSVRVQKSPRLVQSNSLRKEVKKVKPLVKTCIESSLQNQAENEGSINKNVKSSTITNQKNRKSDAKLLARKVSVRVKKSQKLTRPGIVNPIPGRRQQRAVKQKGNRAKVNIKQEPSKGSDDEDTVRIPRKRSNKVQLEWCSYCGLQLDSVENRLEHEFSHEEPRQLQISLHLCNLNSTSVKLPVYVDLDEVAALKSPKEDDYSPDSNKNRPLFNVDDVLNEDEYEAYEDTEDTSDLKNEDKDHNEEGSVPSNDTNVSTISDSNEIEETIVKKTSPRKAKEKAHVKMRLWVKSQPRVTRSSRSEKQLVQKNENIEECSSLMTADLISDDVLPQEDGLHDYVEVVVDKGSPERIMADDETIKNVDVSATDQGDSEASKTSAELSPTDKDAEESLKEETGNGSKEFEEGPVAASPAVENSDINSNEIVMEDHNFRVQINEQPGVSRNFDAGVIEKTDHNLEVNALEVENEIVGNLGPKVNEISNEIDEDDVRSSDPKLSEINNDNLEDEMEDIESDLCKVDCVNIEDDMENLNANFREMNDGIVGEIIGLDPNENELNNVRSKTENLSHSSSVIDNEKLIDDVENSDHKLMERKGADPEEKTFNKVSTEVNENTVENELESLDRKLTEINNQQDEEERKSIYSNMATTSFNNIEGEASNKDQPSVEVDDVTDDCVASTVPDLLDFGNDLGSEVRKMDSTLAEAKSNTSSYLPNDLNPLSREESTEKVCSETESSELNSTEITSLQNETNSEDFQSKEVNGICTDLAKVSEHKQVEDFDCEPKGTDLKVDGMEVDLEENLDTDSKNKTNIDDSLINEMNDICTDLAKVSEHKQVEDFDCEPKGDDSKVDGMEVDLEENLDTGLKNKTNIDDSQSNEGNNICTDSDKVGEHKLGEDFDCEPKGADSKDDVVEEVFEDSLGTSSNDKTNIDDSQSNEANDVCTDLAMVNGHELRNEVEDSNFDSKGTDSKIDSVEYDLEDSLVSGSKDETTGDSQSNEMNDICTELASEHKLEEDFDCESKGIDSNDGIEDDLEDISDEEDVKQKEVGSKADREGDGLEDISDGEFEPMDEQNLTENNEDRLPSCEDKEASKEIESPEELLGEEKVDSTVSIKAKDNSVLCIEDDMERAEEIVVVPTIKVEPDDDDEDDKDTVILDNGNLENPLELEEFLRMRESMEDNKVDEESRDSDQDEGERENNFATGIENTDVLNEKRVLSLNDECMDGGSNLAVESTENEGNDNLSIAVPCVDVDTPITDKDDSLAVINGDTKTVIFEEENLVKSKSVVGSNTEKFSECEAMRELEEEKTAVCCQ